jgi:7-alpha-hydroxysteroid dehydrogenase
MITAHGSNVVVADLKLEDAEAVSDQINKNGGNAYPVLCDVTEDEDLVKLDKATVLKFRGIDILVHNDA